MNIEAAVEVSIEHDGDLIPLDKLSALRDRLYAVVEEAFPDDMVTLLGAFSMDCWR